MADMARIKIRREEKRTIAGQRNRKRRDKEMAIGAWRRGRWTWRETKSGDARSAPIYGV